MGAKKTNHSWQTLRSEYGLNQQSFKAAISPIQDELDKMAGRKYYRNLTPKMVKKIKDFLGDPE